MIKPSPLHAQLSPIPLLHHESLQRRCQHKVVKQIHSRSRSQGWSKWNSITAMRPKRCYTSSAMGFASAPTTPRLSFQIHFKVDFGVMLELVGSADELGQWDTEKGVSFEWNEGNIWKLDIASPTCGYFEYKIIAHNTLNESVLWEPCENRILEPLEDDLAVALTWGQQEALVSPIPKTVFVNNITETPIDLWLSRSDNAEDSLELDDPQDFPDDLGQSSIAPGSDLLKNATQMVPELDTIFDDKNDEPENVTGGLDPRSLDQADIAEDSDLQSADEEISLEGESLSRNRINESYAFSESPTFIEDLSDDEESIESIDVSSEAQDSTAEMPGTAKESESKREDLYMEDASSEISEEPVSKLGMIEQESKTSSSDEAGCLGERESEESFEKSLVHSEDVLNVITNQQEKKTDTSMLSAPQGEPLNHEDTLADAQALDKPLCEDVDADSTAAAIAQFAKASELASRTSGSEFVESKDVVTNDPPVKTEVETTSEHGNVPTISVTDEHIDSVLDSTKIATVEESASAVETSGNLTHSAEAKPMHVEIAQGVPDAGQAIPLEMVEVSEPEVLGSKTDLTAIEPCADNSTSQKPAGQLFPSSFTAAIAVSSTALATIGLEIYDALAGGFFFVAFGFFLSMGAPLAKNSLKKEPTKMNNSTNVEKKTRNPYPTFKMHSPEAPGLFVVAVITLAANAISTLIHKNEESDQPEE